MGTYLTDINNPTEVNRQKTFASANTPSNALALSDRSATKAPLSMEQVKNVLTYFNTILSTYVVSFNIRNQLQTRDLAYYRENSNSWKNRLARAANGTGDETKIQNPTLPVVMPQVESALAYHAGVFLTGYPIFGCVAVPEQAEAISQFESIIADNSTYYAWPRELMKTIRNGLKYDLGAAEVTWKRKKVYRISSPALGNLSKGKVDNVTYEGNCIRDLDPYNLYLDTRVSPDVNHIDGELAGYSEIMGAVQLKKFMDDLDAQYSMNFVKAFNAPSTGIGVSTQTAGYYIPQINPGALLPAAQNQPFSWMSFLGGAMQMPATTAPVNYQSAYEVATMYIRLIPKAFGIGRSLEVEIWKFIIVNRAVCIYAQRQDNAHGYLPIIVCKPSNDGMKWQSKSFAQNAEPYQEIATGLMSSAMESQRRKVYDRVFYDPERVAKKDIDNVSSVARIPVKNSMFHKDIASAIHVVPYRDEGVADILSMSNNVVQMADMANGQNRVQQGQFQKGNKTRREFDTVMSNSNSRQQMAAIGLEYGFFTPIKEIIKSNILQYQPPTTILQQDGKQIDIDPTVIRKAMLQFKLSDGLLPSDKMISSEDFTVLMQTAQVIPEIRVKYDLVGMFSYQMALRGADWMKSFERTPEEQQQYIRDVMAPATLAAGDRQPPNPQQPAASGPAAS